MTDTTLMQYELMCEQEADKGINYQNTLDLL